MINGFSTGETSHKQWKSCILVLFLCCYFSSDEWLPGSIPTNFYISLLHCQGRRKYETILPCIIPICIFWVWLNSWFLKCKHSQVSDVCFNWTPRGTVSTNAQESCPGGRCNRTGNHISVGLRSPGCASECQMCASVPLLRNPLRVLRHQGLGCGGCIFLFIIDDPDPDRQTAHYTCNMDSLRVSDACPRLDLTMSHHCVWSQK